MTENTIKLDTQKPETTEFLINGKKFEMVRDNMAVTRHASNAYTLARKLNKEYPAMFAGDIDKLEAEMKESADPDAIRVLSLRFLDEMEATIESAFGPGSLDKMFGKGVEPAGAIGQVFRAIAEQYGISADKR